ncbi:hypothetical protein FD06_GL000709 [Apilactobacillus ozensis DSM 23829 = JCM 17196]|uniref:YCII-related domain-containing protein n=1 Tax=Apilactobacillus ozensis DSM 23829 = JCM 17196 TaxID=1423781 RepID=A0A0R2AUV6_9LACO|nr:hypothetical protein [Apilactobacillus ozensis]KRM67558.1 hypothetical protein FD06_GL000709 [Apilactobacillus ozensis DSM 23829 = JCM 17196]
MYLVNIRINDNNFDSKIKMHRDWLKSIANHLFLSGAYEDKTHSGFLILNVDSIVRVKELLSKDIFYPKNADYDINKIKINV